MEVTPVKCLQKYGENLEDVDHPDRIITLRGKNPKNPLFPKTILRNSDKLENQCLSNLKEKAADPCDG